MRKRFTAMFLFLGILALGCTLAYAIQDPADLEIGQLMGLEAGLMAAIVTIFGLGILGITQLVKRLYKDKIKDWPEWARHAMSYGVSAVLSGGVVAIVLYQAGQFNWWPNFILYTVWTWGVANGIWKSLKANRGK